MNTQNKDTTAPLPDYFNAEDKGSDWHLFCKVCDRGWALKKASTHPGNLLHLLNHARGHKTPNPELTGAQRPV